jgi:hypothetical protein
MFPAADRCPCSRLGQTATAHEALGQPRHRAPSPTQLLPSGYSSCRSRRPWTTIERAPLAPPPLTTVRGYREVWTVGRQRVTTRNKEGAVLLATGGCRREGEVEKTRGHGGRAARSTWSRGSRSTRILPRSPPHRCPLPRSRLSTSTSIQSDLLVRRRLDGALHVGKEAWLGGARGCSSSPIVVAMDGFISPNYGHRRRAPWAAQASPLRRPPPALHPASSGFFLFSDAGGRRARWEAKIVVGGGCV